MAGQEHRLTQEEEARLLGVCERMFATHQERLPKVWSLRKTRGGSRENRTVLFVANTIGRA